MFKLHVLDVTQILLWKVSGFLVSKQSTFLRYFQSSKYTEAKHSHIMHVRNNLKYFSISCALCECLKSIREIMKMNKTNSKMSLLWRQQLQVLFKQFHTTADVDKNEEYTHEYLRKKAKPYNFVHYCQRSFTSLFVNWRYGLGKKVPYYCLVQIWLTESTHRKKKNPRFCFWHAHSYYINLIFHLVKKRYKEKNCF